MQLATRLPPSLWFRTHVVLAALAVSILSARAEEKSEVNLFSGDERIRASRFHVLMLFDTAHPNHQLALETNKVHVDQVIERFHDDLKRENAPINQLPKNFEVATTRRHFTDVDEFLEHIDAIEADPVKGIGPNPADDNVVFCWIECEGEIRDGRDTLIFANGKALDRENLRTRLTFPTPDGTARARLTVFITDNCRAIAASEAPQAKAAFTKKLQDDRNRGLKNHIWRALYFGHRGIADVHSASASERAWAYGGYSLFALAFSELFVNDLTKEFTEQYGTPDNFVDWGEFQLAIRAITANAHRSIRSQYFNDDKTPTEKFSRLDANDPDRATFEEFRDSTQTPDVAPLFQLGARAR